MAAEQHAGPAEMGAEPMDRCLICSGALIERKLKKHCTACGVLCETCCDGGAR